MKEKIMSGNTEATARPQTVEVADKPGFELNPIMIIALVYIAYAIGQMLGRRRK